MNSYMQLVEVIDYSQDPRPRYHCDDCGQETRKNIIENGNRETHVCEGCGYKKEYVVR